MKKIFTCGMIAAFTAVTALEADDEVVYSYYDPDGSGDWKDATRWESGRIPGPGDNVRIEGGIIAIATDADRDILENLSTIVIASYSSRLIVSNDNPMTLSAYVTGYGKAVKAGKGRLVHVIGSETRNSLSNTSGWDATDGEMELKYSGLDRTETQGPLAVYAPGKIILTGEKFYCSGFVGDGTFSNSYSSATTIYAKQSDNGNPYVFSGTFEGVFKYQGNDNSCQSFIGSGYAALTNAVYMHKGCLSSDRLPPKGILFRNNGKYEYVGRGGADAVSGSNDVNFNNSARIIEFGAGPYGGHTVRYNFVSPTDALYMNELVLSGENENTAIFDGSFNMRSKDSQYLACYIKKTGGGTWRFTAADKANRGTVAVERGTLEYESIADRGVSCSLGSATVLHSEYTGAFDATKEVDYAYLLGDGTVAPSSDDKVATLKYVGETAATVLDRPVVIKGSGRFSSSTAPLRWKGFSSAGTGGNELILGGDASGCRASGITDGEGSLSLVKDGGGDWTVEGDLDITGSVEARCGGLYLNTCQNYRWYKLTLKENWRAETAAGDGSIVWIAQFGLFDADGRNWVENLKHNKSADGKVEALNPGEAAFAHTDFIYHTGGEETYSLTNAFNYASTSCAGKRSKCNFSPSNNPLGNPDAWVEIVLRPNVTTNRLVRYDIRQYSFSGSKTYEQTFARDVRSWSVHGSMDGVNWEELHSVVSNANPTTGSQWKWIGTNRSVSNPHQAGEGLGPIDPEGGSEPDWPSSVASVSAAEGAVLRADLAAPLTTEGIRIDYTLGGGTIEGFAFAENGVIEIVNAPEGAGRSFEFPLSLVNVSGIGNLSGYGVTINGRNRGWSGRYSNGVLRVDAPGTVILFR